MPPHAMKPKPGMTNGRAYRLLSVGLTLTGSISLSACDPLGFVAERVGGRIGTAVGEDIPTPPAATVVKPGGNACDVLAALGWRTVKVKGADGPDELLVAIGATVDTARACPK